MMSLRMTPDFSARVPLETAGHWDPIVEKSSYGYTRDSQSRRPLEMKELQRLNSRTTSFRSLSIPQALKYREVPLLGGGGGHKRLTLNPKPQTLNPKP